MDKELAHHIAYTAFGASAKINNLIPLLKKHCDKDEYEIMSKKIGACSGEIAIELFNYLLKEHPEIKDEIDYKIKKYGTLLL